MDKTITKITYNGQELSIYIPNINISPAQFFSRSFSSSFIDTTGFYTKLRPACFINQTLIQSISLPKLSKLESAMFSYCRSLSDLTIPKQSIIPSNVFNNCPYMDYTNIDISNIKEIKDYGFYFAYLPASITEFPECVSVGSEAFRGCDRLVTLNLPKCEYLGEGAFINCRNLTSVSIPRLSKIPARCFYSCYSLKSIETENITELGDFAFQFCSALTELTFKNVSSIGTLLFTGCVNLSKLNFEWIGSYPMPEYWSGFYGASSYLKELKWNATNQPYGLYFPRTAMEKLEMPYLRSATIDYFLKSMPKLKEVNFERLEYASSSASLFYNCPMLSKISLPNLYSLGNSAFYSCSALSQAIFMYPSIVSMGNASCFRNSPMQNSTYLGYYGSIYVPARLVNAYKSATNWAQYSDRITSIDNLPQN